MTLIEELRALIGPPPPDPHPLDAEHDCLECHVRRLIAEYEAPAQEAVAPSFPEWFEAALNEVEWLTWVRDDDGDNYVEASDVVELVRQLVANPPPTAQEAVVVTDEMVDRLARSKYERFDSHFAMPGGFSWDEYRVEDPQGAQFYINDATDDLTAALARPAQAAPVDRAVCQHGRPFEPACDECRASADRAVEFGSGWDELL